MSINADDVFRRLSELCSPNVIKFKRLGQSSKLNPIQMFESNVSVDKLTYGKPHLFFGTELTLDSHTVFYTWVEIIYIGKDPGTWKREIDKTHKTVVYGETMDQFLIQLNQHLDSVERLEVLTGMAGWFTDDKFEIKRPDQ